MYGLHANIMRWGFLCCCIFCVFYVNETSVLERYSLAYLKFFNRYHFKGLVAKHANQHLTNANNRHVFIKLWSSFVDEFAIIIILLY